VTGDAPRLQLLVLVLQNRRPVAEWLRGTPLSGPLPPDPDALRVLNAHHVVDIEGFGTAACAGAYARVVRGGRVRRGDAARLA